MNSIKNILRTLKETHLYRERKQVSSLKTFPTVRINGQAVIHFGSNNYLGFCESLTDGTKADVTVQESSPLISGYTDRHAQLEAKLAQLKGQNMSLLFSSGFLANLSTLTSLAGSKDLLLIDKMSHASIMEATRYREVSFRTFPHRNYRYAEKLLKSHRTKYSQVYLVSDSLFSMEGDEASLEELLYLAKTYDAWLLLDDAHAMGVYGEQGEGFATAERLEHYEKLIITGTLSKALASYGGFIAADDVVIDLLINKARPYLFNTALPLVHVASALAHLEVIAKIQPQKKLWGNIQKFNELLGRKSYPACSPIIPIACSSNEQALTLSKTLFEKGFFVPAIRYPTVPHRKAMLRVSLSAAHTTDHLYALRAQLP